MKLKKKNQTPQHGITSFFFACYRYQKIRKESATNNIEIQKKKKKISFLYICILPPDFDIRHTATHIATIIVICSLGKFRLKKEPDTKKKALVRVSPDQFFFKTFLQVKCCLEKLPTTRGWQEKKKQLPYQQCALTWDDFSYRDGGGGKRYNRFFFLSKFFLHCTLAGTTSYNRNQGSQMRVTTPDN